MGASNACRRRNGRHGRYGRHGRHDVKPGPRSTLLQYLHCRAFTTEPPWAFNVCLQLAYCKHDILALIYRFKPQMKCLLSIYIVLTNHKESRAFFYETLLYSTRTE